MPIWPGRAGRVASIREGPLTLSAPVSNGAANVRLIVTGWDWFSAELEVLRRMIHTVEVDLDGRKITLETGKVAKQANGALSFAR